MSQGKTILLILQIIVPLLLIGAILLQARGAALGETFGGTGEFYFKRRGMEKILFGVTIFLGALFLVISLLNLIFRS